MVDKTKDESINEELEKKRQEFQDEIAQKKPAKKATKKEEQVEKKPTKQRKTSKKKLAVGLVLLAVLLAGLIGAALYALWFSPERAVSDAITKALASQSLSFQGTLTAGNAIDAQFNGATIGSQGSKLTFTGRLDYNNQTGSVSGDVVIDKDGTMYASVSGAKNALAGDTLKDASVEGSYANLLAQKIDGKWLKITSTDLQPFNRTVASMQSCFQSVIQRNQGEGPIFQEAADTYQRNRFIVVDKVVGRRDSSTGYAVHLDNEKLKAFLADFKSSVLYRQLRDCDSATFDINPDTLVRQINEQAKGMEIWVNQSHEITEIVAHGSINGVASEVRVTPQFNQETKIIVPASTLTIQQLQQYLLDAKQAELLNGKTDKTSQNLLQQLKDKLQAS